MAATTMKLALTKAKMMLIQRLTASESSVVQATQRGTQQKGKSNLIYWSVQTSYRAKSYASPRTMSPKPFHILATLLPVESALYAIFKEYLMESRTGLRFPILPFIITTLKKISANMFTEDRIWVCKGCDAS